MTNTATIATTVPPKNLENADPDVAVAALDQAREYDSVFGPTVLDADSTPALTDGGPPIEIPPPPDYGMLGDDEMEAYEELLFEVDTAYDREPDVYIPEQRLRSPDGTESGIVLPAETQRGALKRPYRKGGELVKPPHTIKVVQATLGEEVYDRLKANGIKAGQIWQIWSEHALRIRERQQRDSKSVRSTVDLAAVPKADS